MVRTRRASCWVRVCCALLSLGGMALLMWGVKRAAATLHLADAAILAALALGLVLMILFFVLAVGGTQITYTYVAISMALSGLSMGAFSVGSTVIMRATPPESASSGAAFEEIAYDLGNVLGVAFLGSVAGVIYRAGFSVGELSAAGLTDAQIADALGSYGAAVSIAQETGVGALISQGALSFNQSLVFSAVAGGCLLLLLAFVVSRLIPKGYSIAEE